MEPKIKTETKSKNFKEWNFKAKNFRKQSFKDESFREEDERLVLFLSHVVKNPKTHAKWLNTLSFLEHIGSRKIVKSQNSKKLNLMLLEHIAEESRHAYFFKRLARKIGGENFCLNFEDDFMIEGKKGEEYFQSIDHNAEDSLRDLFLKEESKKEALFLNYLYTTWLVERRALWIYNIYSKILKVHSFSFNLKPVLMDEEKHLKTVEGLLNEKDSDFLIRSKQLSHLEEKKFHWFLDSLLNSIKNLNSLQKPLTVEVYKN